MNDNNHNEDTQTSNTQAKAVASAGSSSPAKAARKATPKAPAQTKVQPIPTEEIPKADAPKVQKASVAQAKTTTPAKSAAKPAAKAKTPANKTKISTSAEAKATKTAPAATKPVAANTAKAAVKPAKSTTAKPTAATPTKQATNVQPSPAPAPAPAPKKSAAKIRRRKPLPPAISSLRLKWSHYVKLMRLDKPIGILLLLWPTLWALWLAAKGMPRGDLLVIFVLGVVVMRSAGCVINDFADRKIDGQVKRTQERPLATGAVSSREAIGLFICLCILAFGLVLMTDWLTIKLSIGGLLLAFSYPFMKRHTHLPQVVLGAAFAWGIPMAYAAQKGSLDKDMWLIYLAVVLWTVVYDTFYAMVDRDDDMKIGVKSTAILFGDQDRFITGTLQAMTLYTLMLVGQHAQLGKVYYLSLVVVAALFAYQQWLIRFRERNACFKAFLNNNWVGAAVFAGIAGDLLTR